MLMSNNKRKKVIAIIISVVMVGAIVFGAIAPFVI